MRNLWIFSLVAACGGSDIGVKEAGVAYCDGQKNEEESTVDAPFDKDGDGFFDGDNPDCVDTYPPELLDCDDEDPDIALPRSWYLDLDEDGYGTADDPMSGCGPDEGYVDNTDDCDDEDADISPSAEEVCEDDIDNDCDGDVDEECPVDFSGGWTGDTSVAYSCAMGSVSMNFNRFQVIDTQPTISITSLGSAQPGTMDGTIDPADWSFNVEVDFPGTCNENYSMNGRFTDENTMEATFQWSFSGWTCMDCAPGVVDIIATRD